MHLIGQYHVLPLHYNYCIFLANDLSPVSLQSSFFWSRWFFEDETAEKKLLENWYYLRKRSFFHSNFERKSYRHFCYAEMVSCMYNCILPAKKWRNIIENGSIFLAFALHKSNIALKENWNKSSIHLLHYFFTFAHYTPWANIWKHTLHWLFKKCVLQILL